MEFNYSTMFPIKEDKTRYKKLTNLFVSQEEFKNQKFLVIEKEGLKYISEKAFFDV